MQIPPAFAALKFRGRNYYEYARAGIDIPRVRAPIEIAAIELIDWAPPTAVLRVASGKGTYIRVLAEDIAAALACCAHLAALRRTVSGPFSLAGAVTLEALQAMDAAARDSPAAAVRRPVVRRRAARRRRFRPSRRSSQGRAGVSAAGRRAGTLSVATVRMDRFLGLVEAADGSAPLRCAWRARTRSLTRLRLTGLALES